jgi:putative DNA primase/helicase
MEISIATGKSRKTKTWNNQKIEWSVLVRKLTTPITTGESFKDYMAFSKSRQAEIKDRGGFVGGFLNGGRRSPGTVKFRQVLTLDIDLAYASFWDDFINLFGCAAVLHSTHKHCEKSPRYRLVVLLDRKASSEEYEAIGRKLASYLDINIFDPTTFQAERLMYWPTIASDGDWVAEIQKGEPLNCDTILNSYEDWTDISSWPKPDSEKDFIHKTLKLQGKPADKPGLIGAFCRTFDIDEVISEFLSDIYEPTDQEGRYTFIDGSAAAGAIVYGDSEFLYSHHGTDPVHGQLVNSFDLVRLHKFGHEDTDIGEREITRRASYRLMNEFARNISGVVKEIGVAKISAVDDFDDDFEIEIDPEYSNKWLGDLTLDKYNKFESSTPNFEKIIKNDPLLKGLKFDRFNLRPVSTKPLPWNNANFERQWTDDDDSGLRLYLENRYGIYNTTKYKDALAIVFRQNSFHPITNYLDKLVWDNVPRLDTMLIDYLGASDTRFVRLATRKAFVAAVARVYKPGIKFDYVLTLIGEEGIRKSTILNKMGGKWFSDSFVGVEGNKAYEQLQGAWLIEMGELSGIKRAEAEAVKHFITKRSDRFRVAYGTRIEEFERQCVFFGTTNKSAFLQDNHGNRRFWPVAVNDYGELDIDDMHVDQLWAEAVMYYNVGERLYFDADVEEEARILQSDHTEKDEREGVIANYLAMLLPPNWEEMKLHERKAYINDPQTIFEEGKVERRKVCIAEIWCELFQSPIKDMGTHNTKYIHQIMASMKGWEKSVCNMSFSIYGKQRAYVNTDYAKILKSSRRSKAKRKFEKKLWRPERRYH